MKFSFWFNHHHKFPFWYKPSFLVAIIVNQGVHCTSSHFNSLVVFWYSWIITIIKIKIHIIIIDFFFQSNISFLLSSSITYYIGTNSPIGLLIIFCTLWMVTIIWYQIEPYGMASYHIILYHTVSLSLSSSPSTPPSSLLTSIKTIRSLFGILLSWWMLKYHNRHHHHQQQQISTTWIA